MAAILDYCVPSRRRERIERKEKRALASHVDSRWGDSHITAPSDGGWNQPLSLGQAEKDVVSAAAVKGSPDSQSYSGSSFSTTPDLSLFDDKTIEADINIETKHENVPLPQPRGEKSNNITFTITLPWPSRKVPSRRASVTQSFTESPPKIEPPSRPSTAHSPPPVVYKPISSRYMQELAGLGKESGIMNPLAQSPPDHIQTSPPIGNINSVSEDHTTSALHHAPIHVRHADVDQHRRPTPPSYHSTPGSRLDTIPATPYCVYNFSEDDRRMERPETAISSFPPPPVVERRPRERSTSRGPPSERQGRMKSSSRGPSEDRVGTARSASRASVEDRMGAVRSSSRGSIPDRIGTTRSPSAGPPQDRVGAGRSSSKGPTLDHAGRARSASRGPAADRIDRIDRIGAGRSASRDRIAAMRSASRDRALDHSGRGRSASVGPPTGRIAMVRSASREPTTEGLGHSRLLRRASFSSDTSSATSFSDDEDNKPAKHQQVVSPSVTMHTRSSGGLDESNDISNPQGPISGTGTPNNGGYYTSVASEHRQIVKDVEQRYQAVSPSMTVQTQSSGGLEENNDTTGPEGPIHRTGTPNNGGYYTSLASEYRQIAKDVETQDILESGKTEGKGHKKAEKVTKARVKSMSIYTGPHELVPSAADLYG